MKTTNRFIIIMLVVVGSVAFIWPNFANREVIVHFQESLQPQEQAMAADALVAYVQQNYKDRFTVTHKDATVSVKGRFIQTAFLNDIGRQQGVDPSKNSMQPLWVENALKVKPFKLGLDLQGGMNLVLESDFEKLKAKLEEQYPVSLRESLQKQLAEEKDPEKRKEIEFQIQTIKNAIEFSPERMKLDTEGAMEIIRSRIDRTGVSEPLIRMQGDNRIEISLPGVASPEQAKKIVSSTARVEYRLAEKDGVFTQMANQLFDEYKALASEYQKEQYLKELAVKINLPSELGINVNYEKLPGKNGQLELQADSFMVLEREVALSGAAMSRNVYANYDEETLQYTVEFTLTDEGRKKFADVTSNNKGRALAILIDDKIRSAPVINEPITGGSARISGSFSMEEANDLALIIKEGALPVPIKIVEEQSTGPTLGQESIEKGINAIMIGGLLVVLYMVLYYHFSGVVATIALMLNLLFMAAIFALMDFTITLPGLAGVVLTLGMAVDANVIVFERMREELARGKTLKTAVSLGFERATYTIIDSNLTTMIVAIILASKLGAGPIKGFGVTLFVGIITTLFTTLYVSKTLVYYFVYDLDWKGFSLGVGTGKKNAKAEVSK